MSVMNVMERDETKTNSENSRARDWTLDFLKGFAIILVIMLHCNLYFNPDGISDTVLSLLTFTGVPIFFMVSGALFFQSDFSWKKHFTKLARYYCVYVVWKALYLVFYHLAGAPVPDTRGLLHYLFLFNGTAGVPTDHFWFMEALMMIMLIAPLFYNAWKTNRKVFYYIAGILFFFSAGLSEMDILFEDILAAFGKDAFSIGGLTILNPLNLQYSVYIFYYMFGAIIYDNRERLSLRAAGIVSALGMAGLLMIHGFESGSLRWGGYIIYAAYFRIPTILLAAGIFLLAVKCRDRSARPFRTFAYFAGRNTLGIFYLHFPLKTIFEKLIFENLTQFDSCALVLAEVLLILITSDLIVLIMKKIPAVKQLVT